MSSASWFSDLKALLVFPFRSPDWRNRLLVGLALSLGSMLVPVIPLLFALGYNLEIMRRVGQGETPELPAWEDWGRLALDGLKVMLVNAVYLLPGYAILFLSFGQYFAVFMGFSIFQPKSGEVGLTLVALTSMLMLFCCQAVVWVVFALCGFPLPMATAHMAVQGRLGAAFQVRRWWALLKANKLGFCLAWVVLVGLYTILLYAVMILYYTLVLCALAPLLIMPLGFYLGLIAAALFGRLYYESAQLNVD